MKMPNEIRQLLTRPMTKKEVSILWEWLDETPNIDIVSDCVELLLESHPSEYYELLNEYDDEIMRGNLGG